MTQPVSTIPNLGPASEALYADAGITTADQLRSLGADTAYEQLLKTGRKPHFIAYYALAMGLQGRPWTDCTGAEKTALRARFDAIVARVQPAKEKGRSEIEAALDAMGVIDKRP